MWGAMNRDDLLGIYDEEYAAQYDDNYLLGPGFGECTAYEVETIDRLLTTARSWLDVACGTGYHLSRFRHVARCGLDMAPAMLVQARRANPDVALVEGDYRDPWPEWCGKWDLVTSMWYAYCYAGSVRAVEEVVQNMVAWTAPGGTFFLPVCDPDVLCKTPIPYRPPADSDDGLLEVSGVVWTWSDQPSGRRHEGLIAPVVEHLVRLISDAFEKVAVQRYPTFKSDCLASRSAIIATGRHARRVGDGRR
jgi:SAM-dependent methyltransferase